MATGRTGANLAMACAVALLLSLYSYSGLYANPDDSQAIAGIAALGGGQDYPITKHTLRWPVIVYGTIFWALSGGNPEAVPLGFVLLHPLLVAAAFALGRMAAGDGAGLWCAWFAALQSLFYAFAGAVLPDLMLGLFLSGYVGALLWAVLRRNALRERPVRHAPVYAAAALCLWLAYLTKEAALIYGVPGLVAALCVFGKQWRGLAVCLGVFGAAFAALMAIDAAVLHALSGDPWLRIHIVAESDDLRAALIKKMARQTSHPLGRFITFVREHGWRHAAFLLLFFPALAGLTACMRLRAMRRKALLLWAFLLFPWLVLTFGSASPREYLGFPIQGRYSGAAAIPAALAAVWLLSRLRELGPRVLWRRLPGLTAERLAGAGFALLLLANLLQLPKNLAQAGDIYDARYYRAAHEAVRSVRAALGSVPIVVEAGKRSQLAFRYGTPPPGVTFAQGYRDSAGSAEWRLPPRPFVLLSHSRERRCARCLGPHLERLAEAEQFVLEDYLGRKGWFDWRRRADALLNAAGASRFARRAGPGDGAYARVRVVRERSP